jgi:hypothetical protein
VPCPGYMEYRDGVLLRDEAAAELVRDQVEPCPYPASGYENKASALYGSRDIDIIVLDSLVVRK